MVGRPPTPPIIRFEQKFKRGKRNECWNWYKVGPRGYGSFRISSTFFTSAHRAAYLLCVEVIPEELFVLHSCDNRACVNPKHLWLGTQLDNVHDMIQKGRKRVCVGPANARYGKPGIKGMLGKRHTQKSRTKMRNSQLGKKHSEETKRKIGLSRVGRKHSEKTKRKISATKRR